MNDNKWNENYELLKAYYEKFKKWPTKKEVYKEKKLGSWCHNQRTFKKKGKLKKDREKRLTDIRFVWDLHYKRLF